MCRFHFNFSFYYEAALSSRVCSSDLDGPNRRTELPNRRNEPEMISQSKRVEPQSHTYQCHHHRPDFSQKVHFAKLFQTAYINANQQQYNKVIDSLHSQVLARIKSTL